MRNVMLLVPDSGTPRPRGLRKRAKPIKAVAARRMRKNPTEAEALLWERLRSRKCGGFKFRRQSVVLGWIADFYCPEARLVVELDGGYHNSRIEADRRRDHAMCGAGISVLRLSNAMVTDHMHSAIGHIKAAIFHASGSTQQPVAAAISDALDKDA